MLQCDLAECFSAVGRLNQEQHLKRGFFEPCCPFCQYKDQVPVHNDYMHHIRFDQNFSLYLAGLLGIY